MAIFIVVDGSSGQREAIAARLADCLGVALCLDPGEKSLAMAEGRSCVVQGCAGVPRECSNLRILLFDDESTPPPAGYDLYLNSGILGVGGSAELVKQFVVQRLVRCREATRRV